MADRRIGTVHRLAEGEIHIPPGLPKESREDIAAPRTKDMAVLPARIHAVSGRDDNYRLNLVADGTRQLPVPDSHGNSRFQSCHCAVREWLRVLATTGL